MASADNAKNVRARWPNSYQSANIFGLKKQYDNQKYFDDYVRAICEDLETTGHCSVLEDTLRDLDKANGSYTVRPFYIESIIQVFDKYAKILHTFVERSWASEFGYSSDQIPVPVGPEHYQQAQVTQIKKYMELINQTLSLGKQFFINQSTQERTSHGNIPIEGSVRFNQACNSQIEDNPPQNSGIFISGSAESQSVQTSLNITEDQQREMEELLRRAYIADNDRNKLLKMLDTLEAENQEAHSILDAADAYKQKSQQDAETIINNSCDEATVIIEQAQREAQRIKEAAEQEAARIQHAANTEAESCRNAGKKVAEQILEEARKEAEQTADGLVKRYLRMELANQSEPQTIFTTSLAKEVGVSKENATDGAYKIESTVRKQLEEFKYAMQETLDGWRRNLYGQEYQPLAHFYQTLYRQLGSGSKTVQTIVSQITRLKTLDAPSDKDDDLLRRLESLRKELVSLVTQLGKVMGGLGLEIVLPQKGDPFNQELHIDEDADSGQETVAGEIDSVRYPAVCGRDASGGRMTILPAAVTVKNSETAGDAT